MMIIGVTTYYPFGENYSMNFSNEESFKWGVKKGLESALKYLSNKVIVFTNERGKEYLLGQGLCTEEMLYVLDFGTFDERFWNWPKLVTYRTITDSIVYESFGFTSEDRFVHFDIADFFFEERIEPFESDILTERIRNAQLFSNQYEWLGEDLVKNYWPKIITSGCLGGRLGDEIWKELYDFSKSQVDLSSIDEKPSVNFEMLVGIEELVLTYLSRKLERSHKVMNINSFTHLQGAVKRNLISGREEEFLLELKNRKDTVSFGASIVI